MDECEKTVELLSAGRPRPVLMIPVRRCGSHAIRLRLNFNPAFYSPYPLHTVDFMPLVRLYGNLADDDAYFQLIVDLIGLQNANMVRWEGMAFDPVALFETLRDKPRSVYSVVWEMLWQAGEAHGAHVVMDKSLDSVHSAGELVSLFDDILFLNVVRDPRAQVASMNRAIIHDFDTLLNAQIWVRAHDAARQLMEMHPERVLTIRFEDFLANPEATLQRVCAFLGLEFLPEMLDISRSDEARRLSKLSALWESNASAPITANADKFRKLLGDEELRIVETLAGEHMDFYGYERMTAGKSRITDELIQHAVRRSEERQRRAWEELKAKNPRDCCLRRFRAEYLSMIKSRLLRNAYPVARTPAEGETARQRMAG